MDTNATKMDKVRLPKILFVCLGNICRSPAAEGIMLDVLQRHGAKGWTIDSAGTGDWHVGDLPYLPMREAAARRGYALNHRCRQVRYNDFENFDLIIGMDDNNVRTLRQMSPSAAREGKIRHIGQWLDPAKGYAYVPDPYYGGKKDFELAVNLLEDACENIYQDLTRD